MNILFDQTMAQCGNYNGAAEYAQTVFMALARQAESAGATLFSLYDSRKPFQYVSMHPSNVPSGVVNVDVCGTTLRQVVADNHIDLLFIPCLQWFFDTDWGNVDGLGCKVVAVIHDLCDEEMSNSKVLHWQYADRLYVGLKYAVGRILKRVKRGWLGNRETLMMNFLQKNNSHIVTVSEYSKASIGFNYPKLEIPVSVYASPNKQCEADKPVENAELAKLIESGKKYLFIISGHRPLKNCKRVIDAFKAYEQNHFGQFTLATVGVKEPVSVNHVALPSLSPSDLEHAYKNCHAFIYASLFEGYGYPPVEAMKYGKPVLCSNACSMPEVLGDAPIYFSPMYATAVFQALEKFSVSDYAGLQNRSLQQYNLIIEKQQADLQALCNMLFT